jgi:hypothetical protein
VGNDRGVEKLFEGMRILEGKLGWGVWGEMERKGAEGEGWDAGDRGLRGTIRADENGRSCQQ